MPQNNPPVPPEQQALFAALTSHFDATNQTLLAKVKEEIGEHKVEVNNKLHAQDEKIAEIQKDTSVALAKSNAAVRGVSEVLKKVALLEAGKACPGVATAKLSMEEVLRLENKKVSELIREAKNVQATVVVGYHRSVAHDRLDRLDLAKLVQSKCSGEACQVDTRGRVGLVHFGNIGNRPASLRAADFIRNLEESQDADTFWARRDRPEELRKAEGQARNFGKFFQSAFPTDNQPSFRCVDGYLLVEDVVVGPVTLIGPVAMWKQLSTAIFKVLCNPARRSFDVNQHPFHQLRESIIHVLHAHYDRLNFVFDDTQMPSQAHVTSKKKFVVPQAMQSEPTVAEVREEVEEDDVFVDTAMESQPEVQPLMELTSSTGSRPVDSAAAAKKAAETGGGSSTSTRNSWNGGSLSSTTAGSSAPTASSFFRPSPLNQTHGDDPMSHSKFVSSKRGADSSSGLKNSRHRASSRTLLDTISVPSKTAWALQTDSLKFCFDLTDDVLFWPD